MKKLAIVLIMQIVFGCTYAQNPSSNEELLNFYFSDKGIYGHSIEDYFQKPKRNSFHLSPDGMYLSFFKTDYEGKNNLFVKNTETGKETRVIDAGSETITAYRWLNSKTIIYLRTKGNLENYELYSISVSGRYKKRIIEFKEQIPRIVDEYTLDKENIMLKIRKANESISNPYVLNLATGNIKILFDDKDNSIFKYILDENHEVQGYVKTVNKVEKQIYYKSAKTGEFVKVLKNNWNTKFDIIGLDYYTENPNDVLVVTDMINNTSQVIFYDIEKDFVQGTLITNKKFDIDGVHRSKHRNHVIDYYYYTSDKRQIVPFSKFFKKIHKKIKSRFGDKNYSIASTTDKEDKYLLLVGDDKTEGIYYIYDVVKDVFTKEIDTMPNFNSREMVNMQSVQIKTRDGLNIQCYISYPVGSIKGSNVPLIVKPSNTVFSSRSKWSFNREDQLFASRGYASLHINTRGSLGYGRQFKNAGYKQVGRKMLEDIEDAIKHIKKTGIIDDSRIAIYGKDFGGFTALQALAKYPDMFKCAVSKYGPMSLISILENIPDSSKAFLSQYHEQYYNINDETEKQIAMNVSPLYNADKISKPVFIIQSKYAKQHQLDNTNEFINKLNKSNVDSFYILDDDKNINMEKDKIDFYKSLLGFFDQYLKKK